MFGALENRSVTMAKKKRKPARKSVTVKPVGRRPDGLPPEPSQGPKGKGRPFAIQDVEQAISIIEGCGQIHCTQAEVAAVLKVDEDTLVSFFRRVPEAREAYERGKETGKASLRRHQFKLAEKNATMAIFLGMNILDQQDKRNLSGKVQHEHTIMDDLLNEIDAVQRQREAQMIDVTPTGETTHDRS